MPSNEFKREPRYIVFKVKDTLAHLSACQLDRLQEIGETVASGRSADGKPPLNVVVVESDWPEFEPTWAAIEARMTGSAIEAAVLQAQEPVAWLHNERAQSDVITSAVKKLLSDEKARYGFDSLIQRRPVSVAENYTIPLYAAPQPPAPCQKCAQHEIDFALEHDDKLELQSKVAEQSAEIERLTTYKTDAYAALQKKNNELDALQSTIAQQAERIAELERREFDWARSNAKCTDHISAQAALIEKCEKDLILIHGLDYKNAATNCCAYSAHILSKEALAAIATHKEGNQ